MGKPSKGTPADKRLKVNKTTAKPKPKKLPPWLTKPKGK